MVDQLSGIQGAAVYTFDYSQHSLDWVSDPTIGPHLVASIDCLARAASRRVVIVAHSMGGLASAWAQGQTSNGRSVAGEIEEVDTLGTPTLGSQLDGTASDVEDSNPIAWAVFKACGELGEHDPHALDCWFVSAADTRAGRAMRPGSPQLAALPAFGRNITVHRIAGNVTFTWHLLLATKRSTFGDIPVAVSSATSGGTDSADVIPCAVDLPAFWSTSCYHGNLTRNLEVAADVARHVRAAVLRSGPNVLPPLARASANASALQKLVESAGIANATLLPTQCANVAVLGADLSSGDADLEVYRAGEVGCIEDDFGTIYIIRGGRLVDSTQICDCGDQTDLTLDILKHYGASGGTNFYANTHEDLVPGDWIPQVPVVKALSDGEAQYKPTEIPYTGDGTGDLSDLHWTSWGPNGATATGTDNVRGCVPDCAGGAEATYPATVTLSGASQTGGYFLFTQMKIVAPAEPGGGDTYAIPR